MKVVTGVIEPRFVYCPQEFSFEVEDDATETEIQEMVMEEVWENIDVSWSVD